jgi:lipopolysaccharide biosynthesis regulator YciM
MDIVLQWLLLTVAVAVGWLVGRLGSNDNRSGKTISDEESVKDRLQFLFTNYSDQAVENFVQSLAVNKDTVSLHLSIGSHFFWPGPNYLRVSRHRSPLSSPGIT